MPTKRLKRCTAQRGCSSAELREVQQLNRKGAEGAAEGLLFAATLLDGIALVRALPAAVRAAPKLLRAGADGVRAVVKGVVTRAGGSGGRRKMSEAAAREMGILRDAAKGSGNFGLGAADAATAERLGHAWVGKGARVASDGKTLISTNGLRQFRPPSWKPKLGRVQSNFEQRAVPSGRWTSNGHLDIVSAPVAP